MHHSSWPSAIIHVDADCFFASCEIALNPNLRGKPIAVIGGGSQKGVVTAASYEARPYGLKAGMPTFQARKACPRCIFIEGHFEHYGMLSRKIFAVLDTFSPIVEEASIDEGYVDITGLRRMHQCSYEDIARHIQETVYKLTSIPISIGLTPTKILSKIASDFQKPRGFVVISGKEIEAFTKSVPMEDVPGIGPNSQALLKKYNVHSAWDITQLGEHRLAELFGKKGTELFHELSGHSVYAVTNETKPHKSISRSRTLEQPTTEIPILRAQLIQNLSYLTARLRRYGMATRMAAVFLRDQQFITTGAKTKLPRYMRIDEEILPYIESTFHQCYRPGSAYRLTGIALGNLSLHHHLQPSLFDNPETLAKQHRMAAASDLINNKFGRGTLMRAGTARTGDALIVCSFKKGSDIVNQEL